MTVPSPLSVYVGVVGACVTVTSTGLPVAPVVAVTRMVAVRAEMPVFAVKPQLMVPELVPLAPDVIESQPPSHDVTAAVQCMVPVPVFETLNVVVPASLATARLAGLTEMTEGSSPDCPPRTART